jgi:hypothetical protein
MQKVRRYQLEVVKRVQTINKYYKAAAYDSVITVSEVLPTNTVRVRHSVRHSIRHSVRHSVYPILHIILLRKQDNVDVKHQPNTQHVIHVKTTIS